jgi:rRNA maturation protein Nop10
MANHRQNTLYSALTFKCPNCGKSSMFENPALYTFENMGATKNKCNVCGTNLKPETGFYFGAAYVSWALTVALWVSVLVALKTFDALGWIEFGFLTHPWTFLGTGFGLTILLFPYMFRLSRSIWAHMFIKKSTTDQEATSSY